jgi:hypothetical protein
VFKLYVVTKYIIIFIFFNKTTVKHNQKSIKNGGSKSYFNFLLPPSLNLIVLFMSILTIRLILKKLTTIPFYG